MIAMGNPPVSEEKQWERQGWSWGWADWEEGEGWKNFDWNVKTKINNNNRRV